MRAGEKAGSEASWESGRVEARNTEMGERRSGGETMNTSDEAVQFLEDHAGHEVVMADNPPRRLKGLLCLDCADTWCEVPREEWASEPVLASWEAEQRQRLAKAHAERRRVLEAVRDRETALLPEVRFGANWYGDWEP
jgi:hypothetical protein